MKLNPHEHHVPDDFDAWVASMQAALNAKTSWAWSAQVDLRDLFLSVVPDRQWHNCNCCLKFLLDYGDMYWYENEELKTIWLAAAPKQYRETAQELHEAVLHGVNRDNPLATLPSGLGSKPTGKFTHFNLVNRKVQDKNKVLHYREASERIAYAIEQGFTEKNLRYIDELLTVSKAYRASQVKGMIDFMLDYLRSDSKQRRDMLAGAHDGLTHPRGSMLGSLIDDLKAGKSAEQIVKAYEEKLDPLAYQRPQVVKQGNIAVAEKLFNELGLERSLHRREITRLDIPQKAWLWRPGKRKHEQIFGHLQPNQSDVLNNVQTMTWLKFRSDLLFRCTRIQWYGQPCAPITLTTAEYPDAKPILRHDHEEARNPVAWWHPGGDVSVDRRLHEVQGLLSDPQTWGKDGKQEKEILYIGQIWTHVPYSGLFPELLRHELREVRSVIEAHNSTHKLCGDQSSESQGIAMSEKTKAIRLRVNTENLELDVIIDRYS